MRTLFRPLAAASLACAAFGATAGEVTITFAHPEKYQDFPERQREQLLKETADHFIAMGRGLSANQELKVEVLEYDLSGDVRPHSVNPHEIRVMRGYGDWPSMNVRYTLTENGQVIKSGQERLADTTYLYTMNQYHSSDPLRYEKQMVKTWFRERLGMR